MLLTEVDLLGMEFQVSKGVAEGGRLETTKCRQTRTRRARLRERNSDVGRTADSDDECMAHRDEGNTLGRERRGRLG